jgi:phage terminase small subunit
MQLLRYAVEFGLTPSAEVALAKAPRPASDEFDAFGGAS